MLETLGASAVLPRRKRPYVFNAENRRRFIRHRCVELAEYLGRPPSVTDRVVMERIAAMEWDLLAGDHSSGHHFTLSSRAHLENSLRCALVELDRRKRGKPEPTAPDWKGIVYDSD